MTRAVLVAAAVLAGLAGTASAGNARTVTVDYVGTSSVYGVSTGGFSGQGSSFGEAVVSTVRTDRTATISVADATGLPVAVAVRQAAPGNALGALDLGLVCGHGTVTLARPGVPLSLYPVVAQCPQGPSAPSRGSITVTLAGARR